MKVLFFISFLFIFGNLVAAPKLQLDVDYASFKFDENYSQFEIYYSFNDNILNYIVKESVYSGELYFKLIISSNIKIEAEKDWIVNNRNQTCR